MITTDAMNYCNDEHLLIYSASTGVSFLVTVTFFCFVGRCCCSQSDAVGIAYICFGIFKIILGGLRLLFYSTCTSGSFVFAIIFFCAVCSAGTYCSSHPDAVGIVYICFGILKILVGVFLCTALHGRDCTQYFGTYGSEPIFIGIYALIREFAVLVGSGGDDDRAEHDRMTNRLFENDESCIPQSLILSDKRVQDGNKTAAGSGIFGDGSVQMSMPVSASSGDDVVGEGELAEEEDDTTGELLSASRLS